MIKNLYCMNCHQDFQLNIKEEDVFEIDDFEGVTCPACEGFCKIVGQPSASIGAGKWETPKSICYDEKGKQYEIAQNGKIIPEAHRKYVNDPRGWKRKGKKKIREYDQHGSKNEREQI